MDGHRALLAGGNGLDGKAGAGVDVAAHEHVGLGGLVGESVRRGAPAAGQLHLAALQQIAPENALANAQDDLFAGHGQGVVFVVDGGEAALGVQHRNAPLEHHAGDLAVPGEDLLGAPAAVQLHLLGLGFGHFLRVGGHGVFGLQADHGNFLRAAAAGAAGRVDGHVAAADDHGALCRRGVHVLRHRVQKVHRGEHALGVLAGHAGLAAALAAYGDVEGLVAFGAKLVQGHVLAHFHAAADVHAHGADDVDLGVHHVLFQLVGRNAVHQHAAGPGVLLEHGGLVALFRQVEGAGKARGARADDGDFFAEALAGAGGHDGRDVAGGGVQVLLGDELLHRVDGHRGVHVAAGAGVLTAAVAHPAADGGEWVLLFNKGQRLGVAALGRHLQIALHRDVGGAGGLAGSGAGVVAVDPVLVPVVHRPLLRAPGGHGGVLHPGVLHRAVLGAQLLAQLHRARGAELHAAAAGHAVLGGHVGHIGRAAQVGGVEHLA